MFHLEANRAVRTLGGWTILVALSVTSRVAAGDPAKSADAAAHSGLCSGKTGAERLKCLVAEAKKPPVGPKPVTPPEPGESSSTRPAVPPVAWCKDWRPLAPIAEDAAQCLRDMPTEELQAIDPPTWKALASVIIDYMGRLRCAFGISKAEAERKIVTEQLMKILSGIGLSQDQAKICMDSISIWLKDPEAFSRLVKAMLERSEQGGLKADEIIAIHSRLQDPEVRKEFVKRLDSLGMSETPTRKALEAPGPLPNLVDTLAKADRSVVAVGMSFLREVDARGTQALRTARWMRLYIQNEKKTEDQQAKDTFTQALKELLTGFTNEGIEPEQADTKLSDAEIEAECTRLGVDCGAVIRVKFVKTEGALVAEGRLIFNRAKSKDSSHPSPAPAQRPEITSPALDTGCETSGVTADRQRQCLTQQIHAANAFMNALSEQVALFGGLAFAKSPRKIETVAPSLHYGVTITDLMSPDPARAPDILGKGLALQAASPAACEPPLAEALLKRLKDSYQSYVGAVGPTGQVMAVMERNDKGCSVSLKRNNESFYRVLGVGVNPEEVGDDLGRAVGAYYVDVALLKGVPNRQLPPPPPAPPSPWEALAVAGAPFMHGTHSGDRWWGALYTTLDWAGLACGAGAAAFAIEYRNDYAHGNESRLHSANAAATTAFICLGASVLSRGASALHFSASH